MCAGNGRQRFHCTVLVEVRIRKISLSGEQIKMEPQCYMQQAEAEAQLIAAAIAPLYENNRRRWAVGLPTGFAGFVMMMIGTIYRFPGGGNSP
jgi:hypothetical protein